jgi:hypothetical protein
MGSHLKSALTHARQRPRLWYALACVAAILAGLASRRYPHLLPAALGKYPGDTLWALMAFCGLGAVWRTVPTWQLGTATLAFCVAIEFLKLWQAPWLASLRHTTMGHLVFGHAFGEQRDAPTLSSQFPQSPGSTQPLLLP